MPASYDVWTVHPHGPLTPLSRDVYVLTGSLPDMALPRNMVVVRLPDGRLVIHNAIAVAEAEREQLERLGRPSFLVIPNGWHRLDARAYVTRWPGLEVIAPRGSRKRVQAILPVHRTYDEVGDTLAPTLSFQNLAGTRDVEGALIARGEDGATLIVNDLLFNVERMPGAWGFVFGTLMRSAGGFKMTPMTRLTLLRDRNRMRNELRALSEIPDLRRIVMAHGAPVLEDVPRKLQEIADSL